MKREFTHETFEDFLKRSADNLRMKAPEKVWQNLSKELHKRRRRFTFGLSAVLLITAATGYYLSSDITKHPDAVAQKQTVSQQKSGTVEEKSEKNASDLNPGVNSGGPLALNVNNGHRLNNTFPTSSEQLINSLASGNLAITETQKDETVETVTTENDFVPTIVDSYTEFDQQSGADKKELKQSLISTHQQPLTIESVVNSYKGSNKRKIEKQLYFTPTISYRKLSENKSYLRSLSPNTPANLPALNSSVNNNVTHKPDVGFELGFAVKYPVTNKLKIRSGLQFNVNRYDVKAFNSPRSLATIALNNGQSVDSLNRISGYSNVPGYRPSWLQNLSFQLSAPIGVEYLFSDNEKVQFGIGTTVQPTYVLGDRAYLITTDYKKYVQEAMLIRHWNVNTAFETFIIVNSKKAKWQFGPQVRYQLLSSFISEYPVKENLFDFGLKVGVTLNK